MFAMANGHFGRGASLRDAFKLVFDDVIGPKGEIDVARLASKGEEFRRYGITNSNIITREVQALVDDIVKTTEAKGKLGRTENILKKLQDNSILANATKVYQGGDDVWKIFGYEFEKSKLLNIIKGDGQHLDDAEKYFGEVFGRRFEKYMPDGKSLKTREEAIREIAAETIKNTYPNYSYVPTLVQNLRRLPLGNFISFPAEMFRTSFNLIKFGLREMQSSDQFVRQSGAKKLIGFSSAIAAGKVAQESAMNLVGVSEEQLNALRESFVAPWHRSGPLIPVSVERGEKTKYKFINFAYQSPYDVLSAPYYAAMGQINKGRLEEKELDDIMFKAFFGDESGPGAFTSLLSPFISESIITERIADITVRGGKTKTGRRVYSDEEKASDQMVKGIFHLLEGLTPGALTQVTNMARGIVGERGKYKEEFNASDEALALLAGIRITETDVGKAIGFNVNTFLNDQKEARRLLTSQFGLENVNPQTIYREYERLLKNKYQNYSEIRKVFEDAIKLGHEKRFILRKHSRRFTKNDLNIILSGRFIADDFGKLLKDTRLRTVLRNRGITLNEFIDFDRLREIRDKYNRLEFADTLQ